MNREECTPQGEMQLTRLPRNSVWPFVGVIAASTLVVAALIGVVLWFDLQNGVIALLRWLDGLGLWAPVLFILMMAVVVVLLIPGVLLTIGAGFVFGVIVGTACVVLGTTFGALAAFLLARQLFGERAAGYVLNHPRLRMLDSHLPAHAWKVVLFTRLIPFFPSKLANYFFGLTSVSPRAFAGASLLGFIPLSLHNVFLGAIAAELTVEGLRATDYGHWGWLLYGSGFVVAALAVLYLGRWAWRALNEDPTGIKGSRPS